MKKTFLFFIVLFFEIIFGCSQTIPSGLKNAPTVPFPTYIAFGDSITAGVGASPSTNGYAFLISNDLGATFTNRGTSGIQAADMGEAEIYPVENPTDTIYGMIYTILIGTNDANFKGAGAYEAIYNLCLDAEIAWLTIAKKYKTFAQNASVVQTGTWANDNFYLSGISLKSTTNGSTLSLPITTTGGNIYLWYRITDGNGGVFTYQLDGGSTTSVNCFTSPTISTGLGNGEGVGVIRITGISVGTHTILLTVTSATNAGNVVSTFGIGTTSLISNTTPKVFVGGVIKQLNDAKSSDTSAYNSDAQSDVSLMAGDGLNVWFVDVRSTVNSTTDMFDTYHPNNTGHGHLRDAFEPVIAAH